MRRRALLSWIRRGGGSDGSMLLNLEFDASAQSAPQSFRDAMQAAANIIDAAFTDNITVNLAIGYGEVNIGGNVTTLTNGEAEAGPASGDFLSYSLTRSVLQASLDADVQSGVAALPTTSTLQNKSNVVIWAAEEKALGLIDANATDLDGSAGFAADIPANLLVGVALHELTHAMGRAAYPGSSPSVFDLFRFTGQGARLFGHDQTAPASYFSLDNGVTDLADYGQDSDPSDWLNSSSLTPHDTFNEYYTAGTYQYLTPLDIVQMEALGFHTATGLSTHPPATLDDYNGDHRSDLLMRNPVSGDWGYHTAKASLAFSWNDIGPSTLSYSIDGKGDFNGDGIADTLWRNHTTGDWGYAAMNAAGDYVWYDVGVLDPAYSVDGTGDFNGDGRAEVIFRDHATGVWGFAVPLSSGGYDWNTLGASTPSYAIDGAGDFNGDGVTDIIFRNHATGDWGYAAMNKQGGFTWTPLGPSTVGYSIDGTGDFNGDGTTDIIFRNHATGDWGYAAMNKQGGFTWDSLGASNPAYAIVATGDYNGDGITDIAWRNNATGDWGYSQMNAQGGFSWHDVGSTSTAYFVA
jgi:hypothetical protein